MASFFYTMETIPMLLPRSLKLISTLAILAAGVAGCSQKGMYKSEIKDEKLTPLRYPQSVMEVGAMGWGEPGKPLEAFRPANENLSEELIAKMPTTDAAWFGTEKNKELFMGVVASPGPEVLSAVEIADAKAGAALKRDSVKFVDWGELEEKTLDLERMSKAIVRGWYNFPGEALRFDGLAVLRPDMIEYENRPWIVQRSVSANGLQYEVSAETGTMIGAMAGNAMYGEAALVNGIEMSSATTLTINKPMVIGVATAELLSIDPPLPAIGIDLDAADLAAHTFTWDLSRRGERTYQIDPTVLRAEARRNGLEFNLGDEVEKAQEEVVAQVNEGEPVGLTLWADAKPLNNADAQWRRLGEGNAFDAGEIVRLHLRLKEAAYLYMVNKDSDGNAAILYPKVSGHALSRGEDAMIEAGDFVFPTDVIGREGITFSDGQGTESFLVIASRTRLPGVLNTLDEFVSAVNKETSRENAATRSGLFAFTGVTRVVTGYADSTSPGSPADPVFSGTEGATLLTLNLNKVPKP
jgi:hypothetical protein